MRAAASATATRTADPACSAARSNADEPPSDADRSNRLAGTLTVAPAGTRRLVRDPDRATQDADAVVAASRDVEKRYRVAMSAALQLQDVRELVGRRELYRRYARLGDQVVRVADRVWYAVVKRS
jgi:hypothetical protein